METLIYFLLICVHLTKSSAADLRASGHSFFAAMDEDENVKLYWNVSTANKEIAFTVEAKTTGWIGFGISSGQGKMEGADIVIGWVKNGKPYFKEGTTKLIYAFHPDDPSSENDIPQHHPKSSGARSTYLLNSIENVPTLPDDTKTFNFTNNKRALPIERTTYAYRVFEFPKLQKRHDIIQIDPIIQEGNEGVVHHMLLYECRDDFPRSNLSWEGTSYSPDMPPAVMECRGKSMIAGWAVGGQSFYYPEHVGFAIGTHDSPKIAILIIHYDNYEHKTGIVDSSGLRFHYTSQLRKYQAGIFSVGWAVSSSMIIPPSQDNWQTEGYCVEECTAEGMKGSTLPGGVIRIFSSLLHTHLAGRAAYTRHVRKGVELPEIIRDDHYDFNFQEFQIPSKEIEVLPGDSLITVCKYKTGNEIIKGGLGTDEEMCLSFHQYYPKVNLTQCWSKQKPGYYKFRGTHEVPDSPSEWSDKLTSELRKSYQETDEIYVYCSGRNSNPLPGLGKRKDLYKPVIDHPLKHKPQCEVFKSSCDKLTSYSLAFMGVVFVFLFSRIY